MNKPASKMFQNYLSMLGSDSMMCKNLNIFKLLETSNI